MSITTSYPFATTVNYTFDSNLIEIIASKAQLKDITPTNSTCGANYINSINLTFGGGTLTGTGTGGASVSGGKLDLAHNDNRYVDYNAANNADSQQTGAIKFKVTPNYTGSPASIQDFVVINKTASLKNLIAIRHNTGGVLSAIIYDQASTLKVNIGASWSPTASTEYEFELNYDGNTAATRLFINGIQFGSTDTTTFTRDSEINVLRVGAWYNGADNSNFYLDDLIIFDTVQHTANYTQSTYTADKYSLTNPTIKPASTLQSDNWTNYSDTITESGLDKVQKVAEVNGVNKYWNGSNWVNSSGYAQSNNTTEMNTNLSTLDLTNGFPIRPIWYLHSEYGNSTPDIDLCTIVYDSYPIPPTPPNICSVQGHIYDNQGNPLSGIVIKANLELTSIYNSQIQLSQQKAETITGTDGAWTLDLIETESINPDIKYRFEFKGFDYEEVVYRSVPNQLIANFVDLI